MPEELEPFAMAIVFNGRCFPPRILIFKGRTGDEARGRAAQHLQEKTTFRLKDEHTWAGPDGEAVITPFIIEC